MPRLSADLLPSTAANLNNDPLSVDGEKQKGDGYYSFSDGQHTVAHYISDFVGLLEIQGTLASDPVEGDWVTVATIEGQVGNTFTENSSYNFIGNFVWIRAKVTNMTAGNIAKIQLNF